MQEAINIVAQAIHDRYCDQLENCKQGPDGCDVEDARAYITALERKGFIKEPKQIAIGKEAFDILTSLIRDERYFEIIENVRRDLEKRRR